MERYTYFEDGKWRLRVGNAEYSGPWVDRLASYEDTGLEADDVTDLMAAHGTAIGALSKYRTLGTVDDLSALVKARDEGRAVVLPCRVGDTVWCRRTSCDVCEHQYDDGEFCGEMDKCGRYVCVQKPFAPSMLDDIGKTVFLTRAEAEAALSEGVQT